MTRILVIEDERDLALGIRANLEIDGHEVAVSLTGEEGLVEAGRFNPELIILDLMLPGMSGYEVLERLRASGNDAIVLLLSARGEETDKVRGFRSGADDYVTKPFGVMELLARIGALMRRRSPAHAPAEPVSFILGDVTVDPARRAVIREGVEHTLTPKEFDLLLALWRRPDRIVSRPELLRMVWGYADGVTSRTVDVHIAELRRKIERDPANPRHILTVWRAGYRLRP